MVCAGCTNRKQGCSVGCLDYLLESLTRKKNKENKIIRKYTVNQRNAYRIKSTHTYIGGK